MRKGITAVAVVLVFVLGLAQANAQPADDANDTSDTNDVGVWIVSYDSPQSATSALAAMGDTSGLRPRPLRSLPVIVVVATDPQMQVLQESDPSVTGAFRDRLVQTSESSAQTGASAPLAVSGADALHAQGITGSGVTIAVLDSGIDSTHPDLVGAVTYEACFLVNTFARASYCASGAPEQFGPGSGADEGGHGTLVSGVLASQGNEAPIGMAPDASLEAYKVTDSSGAMSLSDPLFALDHIVDSRPDVDVVNISLGWSDEFGGDCSADFPFLADLVSMLTDRGTLVVASSGNESSTTGTSAPACIDDVVAVTGSEATSPTWVPFANVSPTVDVSAPGVGVVSSQLGGGTTTVSGTSFSSPIVAGCIALMKQLGVSSSEAMLTRITESTSFTTAGSFSVPWLDCGPNKVCRGWSVTVDISAGETPTGGDDVILGTAGADVINAGAGNDRVCGVGGNDVVDGGLGNDLIYGGAGDDELLGNDGDDAIFGEAGRDVVRGGKGNDTIQGGLDGDFLYGGVDDDIINGEDGDDRIGGFGGSDTITGGNGNDLIYGGFGADSITGDSGDDRIFGLVGNDQIGGGDGDDVLYGHNGNDVMSGGAGNDVMRGGNATDSMSGNDGDDDLRGGKSNDTLLGGAGIDKCTGNLGNDFAQGCESEFGIP